MIVTPNTEKRILKAMENGAKLVFYKSHSPEVGTFTCSVALRKGDNELRLHHAHRGDEVKYLWKREDVAYLHTAIQSAQSTAENIIKMDCIRDSYPGYRSDVHSSWEDHYVHRNQPVPRWVSEQWETPVSLYGMDWN